VKSSNPVLGRLTQRSNQHASFHRAPAPQPGYGGAYPAAADPYAGGYAPTVSERMTVDDVVVRTVALLAVVGAAGAAAWVLVGDKAVAGPLAFGAAMIGLVLGLIISFRQVTNPAVLFTYAAVEGVFVGLFSGFLELRFPGIVVQAAVTTFAIFFGMAALYRFKVLRATPTFVKWVTGAVIGVFALMLINLFASFFVSGGIHLRDGGRSAIIFSLICIGIASLTFILDFKIVEDGVRAGIDRKYAWYASFGIVVGLVWLYLEILRFLSYMRR
jgi:uncharacterized YccA/Bax inhibitor family protein